ncbi:hypothetical protein CVT24_012123 [Panaeolus cyanescens]|uniref:Acyl-CoA dehydrogenase/oxidase C-terminal domain-containing protein n=1 Tax=Panaeolus cyanescens TaxID=181874 RepID=A0A409YYU7_9AGAR|nr:hypothetical protein CVT24_012123 [Panaeolus cyanescens]
MRIEEGFQPAPFLEDNAYINDPVLPSLLKRTIPASAFKEIESDLTRLGHDVVTSIRALSDSSKISPPTLVQYDQWGRRVDILHTSEGWRELKALSQREGLPGIFYERKYGDASRTYGFAKMMLLVGDTNEIFCPISMTDGLARVIELIGSPEVKKDVLPRLISRDPSIAFTAGQWMTERPGGSDVSQTETTATPTSEVHKYGSKYTLNGVKWFSSATDSEVSVALARTGTLEQGSRGLSLFLIPLRKPLLRSLGDPTPPSPSNNILVHRLKHKIGTQILPTAELTLNDTEGYLLGQLGQGVKNITPVLNITRAWSAMTSVGHLRKCLAIATAYSRVRRIQGGTLLLSDAPIHVAQLATINILYRALAHMAFGIVRLLGKVECGTASEDDQQVLRLLTPVTKAFAAEKASVGMEEAMTALGGAGYMEENGFGRAIRDALVEKIWEGTVVVLSLDVARAAKDPRTLKAFANWSNEVAKSCPASLKSQISPELQILQQAVEEFLSSYTAPVAPTVPRPAAMLLGIISSSLRLLEHAVWSELNDEASKKLDLEVFKRWIVDAGTEAAIKALKEAKTGSQDVIAMNSALVFGAQTPQARHKL